MTPHLLFLGTSDSKGVPRLGCGCAVCRAARPGTRHHRTRAGLLLRGPEGDLLIDTPPEIRLRFTELDLPPPSALFLTHPHDDHILGFADVIKALRRSAAPIFAPTEVFDGLRERFGYLWTSDHYLSPRLLHPLEGPVRVAGWTLEALRVPHGFNGWSYGYLLERDGWRAGYFSDALHVSAAVQARWQGLDLLILGANFWRETAPLEQRSVYDVEEALAVAQGARVGQLILTHLSHKIEADEMGPRLPAWASFAWDGRRVAAVP